MTLEELHAGILAAWPALSASERRKGSLRGYAYRLALPDGRTPRVVRLLETGAGAFELVRAASERASGERTRHRFAGPLPALLSIIDSEIALIQSEARGGSAGSGRMVRDRRAKQVPRARPASVNGSDRVAGWSGPEFVSNGVDGARPLIYRWQIFGPDGELSGVYVGQAGEGQAPTRMARYRSRVLGIQQGRPYSATDPDRDYRRIHHALADAVSHGHRIVLTWLDNCTPDGDLKALETRFILEQGSYGPLPHQLNDRL